MPRWCRRGRSWCRVNIPLKSSLSVEDVIFIPVKPASGVEVKEYVELYDYEVEALKLIHIDGLSIEEAAARMNLSKASFWRVLEQCRFKLAEAVVGCKPMKVISSKQRTG